MTKTIRLMATLRDLVGEREIHLPFEDGQTVRQLLDDIADHYPKLASEALDENGELTGLVHVFVQGRNIMWLDDLDTTIQESDDLLLVPPIAGG